MWPTTLIPNSLSIYMSSTAKNTFVDQIDSQKGGQKHIQYKSWIQPSRTIKSAVNLKASTAATERSQVVVAVRQGSKAWRKTWTLSCALKDVIDMVHLIWWGCFFHRLVATTKKAWSPLNFCWVGGLGDGQKWLVRWPEGPWWEGGILKVRLLKGGKSATMCKTQIKHHVIECKSLYKSIYQLLCFFLFFFFRLI